MTENSVQKESYVLQIILGVIILGVVGIGLMMYTSDAENVSKKQPAVLQEINAVATDEESALTNDAKLSQNESVSDVERVAAMELVTFTKAGLLMNLTMQRRNICFMTVPSVFE